MSHVGRTAALMMGAVALGMLGLFGVVRLLAGEWVLEGLAWHAMLEAVTGLSAALAGILLVLRRRQAGEARLLPCALGLLGMGILCLFHSSTLPGNAFVLSRSLAGVVGGTLALAGWLVPRLGEEWIARRTPRLVAAVVLATVLAGVWVTVAGDSGPAMVTDGRFTLLLVGMEVLAGAGFLGGAALVFLESETLRKMTWLPLGTCLLVFGVSDLVFPWGAIYGAQWWAWHVFSAAGVLVLMAGLGATYQHALSSLADSEVRLRTAFENATVGRSLTLVSGKLAMVNQAFADMVGYTIEEMHTLNFATITHPDDLEISKESIRCLLAGEQSTFRFEKRYIHRDGHEVRTHVSTTLVRDAQGIPLNFVTDIVDISGRKVAERALERSQRELTIANRISRIFLTAKAEDAYDEVQKVFLEAMESKFGVFGYIDEHGAYVVPTMTRHIWDQCQVADKDIVFPRGSWGYSSWPTAIRERRTICLNEPSSRTPEGHIPITRHISLPLIHRGEVIGLLQVANKETDYSPEDVRLFEGIGNIIAPVLYERLQKERQERVRQESEERFRSFFKMTADLACIATVSTSRFVELNPAWEKTLGYTQEELTSRTFIDFIHPADKEPTMRVVQEQLARGLTVLRFENRYVRKDGGVVWLEWTSQPFVDQDRTFALARNITVRKEEERRAEEQDWIKTGVAELNDALRAQTDLKRLCTAAVTQMAGRLDAKVGAVFVLGHGPRGPSLELGGGFAFQPGAESGPFSLGEGLVGQAAMDRRMHVVPDAPSDYLRVVSGTGETRARHIVVVPLLVEERVVGVLELGSLAPFDNLQQQFLARAASILASALESAQGREALAAALQQSQQLSEELQVQHEELRATNEELETQARALHDSERKLRAQQEELEAANEELSEKTRLIEGRNEELERAGKELKERARELDAASRYKSQFLANMSHELRTPLNSLLLLAQSLAENPQGNLVAEQVEAVNVIYDSGRDLLTLINDILDLAKIEAGRTELHVAPLALDDVAQRLRASFHQAAQKKGLSYRVELAGDAPASVATDGQRFEQVLRNLVSNAIKFTEAGEVVVTFAREGGGPEVPRGGSSSVFLAVSVRDTGIGIAAEHHKVIFEAFHQADGGITRRYGGTGLGLAISRELARLLGGEIRLESEAGRGSTFTLVVPVAWPRVQAGSTDATPAAVAAGPLEPVSRPERSAAVLADDRDSLRSEDRVLLVVEDDAHFADILLRKGREKGFKCLVADSGEAGLDLARRYMPCAVLLDIRLPGMDGWAVLEALKEDTRTRHIPVHTVSVEDAGTEARRRAAIGHITKPVDIAKMETLFKRLKDLAERELSSVLVIEDRPVDRRAIVDLISEKNIAVEEVGSGAAALDALRKRRFDCVILDLTLPDIGGIEVLEKLRAEEVDLPPIVVYTSRDLTREEERQLQEHADAIVLKGVRSLERLLDEVSLFLHQVVSRMPSRKREIITRLHDSDQQLRDRKVLVVDDDMRTAFAVARLLTFHGMKALKAEGGEQALSMLDVEPDVDIVLVDIMMPGMDGYETIRRIRAQERFAKLPILVLTAKAMKGDREQILACGASDYLAKPVDQNRLLSMLRVWLYR